jgi:Na+/proline symporter
MVGLSVLAMVFALQVDSLQSLIKVTFSIAAGVAPVYILRWVWFRINAWSQLSAMLSSAVFTLVYPRIHGILLLKHFSMEESRVLVVTVLTSLVWLLVTFFTPNHSEGVRLKMLPIIESRKGFFKRLFLALILGFLLILVVSVSWWIIINQ